MNWEINKKSFAKVNLNLEVLFKRPDHYHEIASLFTLISLHDELWVKPAKQDMLTASLNVPEPFYSIMKPFFLGDQVSKNLILRTVKVLRELFNREIPGVFPDGLHITIEKNIPSPAGIGGGSSNAAVLIKHALSLLFDKSIPEKTRSSMSKKIYESAAKLGADIPFFTQEQAAFVSGIGEALEPLELPTLHGYLLIPNQICPTKDMFSRMKKPLQAEIDSNMFKQSARQRIVNSGNEIKKAAFEEYRHDVTKLRNDFLAPLLNISPKLNTLWEDLKLLRREGWLVNLSGSGSSFFCLHNSEKKADAFPLQLLDKYDEVTWHRVSTL